MSTVPPFNYTSIDRIPAIYNKVQSSFLSHKTRPLEWRLTQLRRLWWGYVHDWQFEEMEEVYG